MPAIDPSGAVFINCPYDKDFEPTFNAIIFATVCCGFAPRSAMESGNVSVSRMERIVRAIFSSRFSIHDLSRCRGEGDEQLARFNMPLELGIAVAHGFQGSAAKPKHDWFLLVPDGHSYGKFISDLAGFDPERYDGKPESAVKRLMAWFTTRTEATLPSPTNVLAALPTFQAKQADLRAEWGGPPPWKHQIVAAREIARARL